MCKSTVSNLLREVFDLFCKTVLVSIAMILVLINIAGSTPFVYIMNYGSNKVSVINTTIDTVTANVPVLNNF